MKKDFNKFISRFRKELKEAGFKLRIYNDKDTFKVTIRSEKNQNFLTSEFEKVKNDTFLKYKMLKWYFSTEEHGKEIIEKTISFWEQFALSHGCCAIVLPNNLEEKEEAFAHLKKLGFVDTKKLIDIENIHLFQGEYIIKEIFKNYIFSINKFIGMAEEVFEELKKEYPAISLKNEKYYRMNKEVKISMLGFELEYNFNIKDGLLIIEEKNKGKVVECKLEKEELLLFFKRTLDEHKEKQKMKNLFDPPKKFFKHLSYLIRLNEKQQNNFYRTLRKNHEPEKIEEEAANNIKTNAIKTSETFFKKSYKSTVTLYFIDRYYLIDFQGDIETYNNKQEMMSKFEEKAKKRLEEYYKEEMIKIEEIFLEE